MKMRPKLVIRLAYVCVYSAVQVFLVEGWRAQSWGAKYATDHWALTVRRSTLREGLGDWFEGRPGLRRLGRICCSVTLQT